MTAVPVAGYCPSCGRNGLIVGEDGSICCSRPDNCRNPAAAGELLADRETEHLVTLTGKDFTIRHPLIERLDGALEDCALHEQLVRMGGPPRVPGKYRVYTGATFADHAWERL